MGKIMKSITFLIFFIPYLLYSQDINRDGIVDSSDMDSIISVLGDSLSDIKDITGDGRVDGIDYFIVSTHYEDSVIISYPDPDSVRVVFTEYPAKSDSFSIRWNNSLFSSESSGTLLYKDGIATLDSTFYLVGARQRYILIFFRDVLYTWTGWTNGIGSYVNIITGFPYTFPITFLD